ncbi:BlaI/MecI/CopY family transcriptional regulator, partial [Lachnospiraceae bacterium 46-61]
MRRVKEIKKVTEAEYKVLEVLWESNEMMIVNQIMEELRKKGTIWANRTILVFLNNLEKKEAVS